MKKSIIFLFCLGFLSACQPPLTREQQLAIYRSRCLDYGYLWGTPEFADCVKEQDAREEKLAIQRRKVNALEQQNWIEEQKVQVKQREVDLKHKQKKKNR